MHSSDHAMETARTYSRSFFRLRYPPAARPLILIDEIEYEVSEISERGARILHHARRDLEPGQSVIGVVTFEDGEKIEIAGEVFRREQIETVIKIGIGVTYKRMMAEQRMLAQNYPNAFRNGQFQG